MNISVCMATFNGEKYIKQQLDSILCQLSSDDEVIISDDGSTDKTLFIIESFNDFRIKLLPNQIFHNPIFNIENALKNVIGDYIFLSDQDDIWLPNKVETIVNYLQKYDCVVSDAILIDANGNIISDSFFKKNNSKRGFLHNFIKNGYLGCCMAFNKKMLKYILPFPAKIPMHDIWIGLISEIFGKTIFYKKPLIFYRRHGTNYSPTSEKSKNSIAIKLIYRFNILFSLFRKVLANLYNKIF
jgi:glycosyltransferase involved in cell wall biosynthesis